MPIVYIDILLAVNWFTDVLLLSATARILRLTPKHVRVVLGGLVGGVLACVLFLLSLPIIFVLIIHALIAVAMILITFPISGVRQLLSRVTVLYCLSGLFSGVMTALSRVFDSDLLFGRNGVVYFDISPLTLALLACVSYAVMCAYEYLTRKRIPKDKEFELQISDENGVCACRALYDTGLHITEPFSGRPVVIVEKAVIERCVTQELYQLLCCAVTTASCQELCRVRMIPYHAVGVEGVLSAFVPRSLKVRSSSGKLTDISGTYVAVTEGIERDGYEALIGCDSV